MRVGKKFSVHLFLSSPGEKPFEATEICAYNMT